MVERCALYVHWPWCVRKCPYCDFNSHARTANAPTEGEYIDALLADLAATVHWAGSRTVGSVFFGGGTPSLISAEGFARLMQGIGRLVHLANDCEVTLEANPGAVEAARFAAYAHAGVNRFSLGIQSFQDRFLQRLGRIHTAEQAHRAIEAALRVCDNVNLDVMYALPGQTTDDLQCDLRQALAAGTTHLSLYELTIESGTAFAKQPPADLPDEDTVADMTDAVHEATAKAQFQRYEISGYARAQHRCRHNLTYWTFGDYIGIGAGAHGKLTIDGRIVRTARAANPLRYMQAVRSETMQNDCTVVEAQDVPFEFMLNVLRLIDGVPTARWHEATGLAIDHIENRLQALRREGLLVADASRIAVTDLGRRFLSNVQARFLPDSF